MLIEFLYVRSIRGGKTTIDKSVTLHHSNRPGAIKFRALHCVKQTERADLTMVLGTPPTQKRRMNCLQMCNNSV